jgi:hypothetical protein
MIITILLLPLGHISFSYLLREGLGNVEAVAADIEERAIVTEAVLEVGQVVIDAVEGAKPPDKARGDLLA